MYEEMIESSLMFIEENIADNLSLKDISDVFNVSSFHFSRIFAFMIGESYRHYVLKRKLSHSLDMLDKKESIIKTAYSYGFDYPESYTRAFKQVYGLSPKKYQTHHQPIERFGIGKIISRDLVNFKGELFIRCEYEYLDDLIMVGDEILVDKSNADWMKYAYQAGDEFLNWSKKLDYIDQTYYYNEVKCLEYQKLYTIKFMKSLTLGASTDKDQQIHVEGGWFAKFHYKGRMADIYDCLEADIIKWIDKKDEKLQYVANGILLRYDLKDLSEFDILVRLRRKLQK